MPAALFQNSGPMLLRCVINFVNYRPNCIGHIKPCWFCVSVTCLVPDLFRGRDSKKCGKSPEGELCIQRHSSSRETCCKPDVDLHCFRQEYFVQWNLGEETVVQRAVCNLHSAS